MANENEKEDLVVAKQEIKVVSDKNLAIIYLVCGIIMMVFIPLITGIAFGGAGLFGWVVCLLGAILVFLSICGFVSLS